ncbi:ribosome-binding factor A [Candidatus Shikimatogenerans silvanidophilus]|uniref:ribosome-binding factor A n=1 Tax=Candidatus Shikimatogenerans silvanidophilus TaxID=2782547 RepID=UPI001BA7C889|nr:ribosome-binding factor A [Candidatus Shikimatogenerans silvanidophilus]
MNNLYKERKKIKIKKIESLILKEISLLFTYTYNKNFFITVSKVILSNDCKIAKIYLIFLYKSTYTEEKKKLLINIFRSKINYYINNLNKKIKNKLRKIPNFFFYLDY